VSTAELSLLADMSIWANVRTEAQKRQVDTDGTVEIHIRVAVLPCAGLTSERNIRFAVNKYY
jgi:hypothetical protein